MEIVKDYSNFVLIKNKTEGDGTNEGGVYIEFYPEQYNSSNSCPIIDQSNIHLFQKIYLKNYFSDLPIINEILAARLFQFFLVKPFCL